MLLTEGGLEPGTFGVQSTAQTTRPQVGLFSPGPGRAGQGRAGQGRAGQGRAGQGRAGQGRAGQGRAALPSAYTLLIQKERKERAGGHRGNRAFRGLGFWV